jgi:hypothetical protein
MITYADYLSTSEMQRWMLETDIPWDDIQPEAALEQSELLERLRDSALIESFFPILTPRALDVLWDDPAATAIFSVQLYESYKHFHVFNLYLERVGFRPLRDDDLIEVRHRNLGLKYTCGTRMLTQYFMSEHFAAHSFFKDAHASNEKVLSQILQLVARDEVRHAQFGYELLGMRIDRDPSHAEIVLDAARNFTHFGALVVPEVPVGNNNDFLAIITLDQKIQRLTRALFERGRKRVIGMSPEIRNLAWRLNWYRQSELEGALLLGRMVRAANDSFLVRKLTRHAADEARHASLWADAIAEAGVPTIRIFRSYQSLYGDHGGMPVGMQEVLAFTQIFERRVHKRFTAELHQSDLPALARNTFEIMIADESDHLEWVLDWLRTQADSAALLQKYQSIDLAVYHEVLPYENRLWEMAGLGEELQS